MMSHIKELAELLLNICYPCKYISIKVRLIVQCELLSPEDKLEYNSFTSLFTSDNACGCQKHYLDITKRNNCIYL